MVLVQLVTVFAVITAFGWIVSLFAGIALASLLNGVLIYCLGLRSYVEIGKGALEKYIFFGLLSLGLLLSVAMPLTVIWPLTLFLIVTFVGVKTYDLARNVVSSFGF